MYLYTLKLIMICVAFGMRCWPKFLDLLMAMTLVTGHRVLFMLMSLSYICFCVKLCVVVIAVCEVAGVKA